MTLYEELGRLVSRLNARDVPYALCGGLAMAVQAPDVAGHTDDGRTQEASRKGVMSEQNPRDPRIP